MNLKINGNTIVLDQVDVSIKVEGCIARVSFEGLSIESLEEAQRHIKQGQSNEFYVKDDTIGLITANNACCITFSAIHYVDGEVDNTLGFYCGVDNIEVSS